MNSSGEISVNGIEEENQTKSFVAFFHGTGGDFDPRLASYVSQEEMGCQSDSKNKKSKINIGSGFDTLYALLSSEQNKWGFDGCHRRGGGIYASGIKEPADYVYQQLKTQHVSGEKKTVVLTAHSRGCLSAFDLGKQISEDEALKDDVDIIMDLRDPVPGNLKSTASLDAAGITSIAGKLKNLSHCKSIKKVMITVQEIGILPVSFDVLIPQFSEDTVLEVEYLPGIHDVQQDKSDPAYVYFTLYDCYTRHPDLYLLGIYKSLQIYSENNINIGNYEYSLRTLAELHQRYESISLGMTDCDEKMKEVKSPKDAPMLQKKFIKTFEPVWSNSVSKDLEDSIYKLLDNLPDGVSKVDYEKFLKSAQVKLYNSILEEYRNNNKKIHTRSIHFGGEYKTVIDKNDATHLNERHATLENEFNPLIFATKPWLGFKGKRESELSKKVSSNIEHFLQCHCDINIETLYQTFSLTDAQQMISDKIAENEKFSSEVKDEVNRQWVLYQIKHAYRIVGWQKERKPGYVEEEKNVEMEKSTGRETSTDNAIFNEFILNMKKLIEEIPSWDLGKILGWKIGGVSMLVAGHSRILPTHIAQMYEQCNLYCETMNNPDVDPKLFFDQIIFRGLHGSNHKPFNFFGLNKRDCNAQLIYDTCKEAAETTSLAPYPQELN